MKYVFLLFTFLFFGVFTSPIFAQQTLRQNYKTPVYNETLIGTESGLFAVSSIASIPLWQEGSVDKILYADGWYFLTSKGILFSADLKTFELRNNGIAANTIKEYDGEEKTFIRQTHPLKDLEVLPGDNKTLVTTTKNEVFITRDGGLNWTSLGFSARTSGAKAVAVAMLQEDSPSGLIDVLTVFLSHSSYGIGYIHPDVLGSKWVDIEKGFESVPTLSYTDEIADILAVDVLNDEGSYKTQIYFTQTFLPRLYRLNWEEKKAEIIASGTEPADTWDSLSFVGSDLLFMTMGGLQFFSPETELFINKTASRDKIEKILDSVEEIPRCGWFPAWASGLSASLALNELWLTRIEMIESDYSDKIADKKSIYVPAGQVTTAEGIKKFMDVIEDNKLNSLVIDMKDDAGLLRYNSNDSFILEKAQISRYAIDVDEFIDIFKEKDIYLIARLVVFKDKNLYGYDDGKYAVWNNATDAPWIGIRRYEGGEATYYDEYWVDPYSEEVWEYNIAVAKELIERGFDEIQFDYIRFPTDGLNLTNASYRWQDSGMDKESALISFLAYARENIDAPIGIDIYGFNGWYRTGLATGQDVELMASYVDVISPMFYPSHFGQSFLAYTPAVERPYRIYFYGSYRNSVIARNRVLVRPWLQAFYLSVSYDKEFYDDDYVQRQVFGVRDSINMGYMYWNNSGRYTDLRPDIDDMATPYPWTKAIRDRAKKLPALSTE